MADTIEQIGNDVAALVAKLAGRKCWVGETAVALTKILVRDPLSKPSLPNTFGWPDHLVADGFDVKIRVDGSAVQPEAVLPEMIELYVAEILRNHGFILEYGTNAIAEVQSGVRIRHDVGLGMMSNGPYAMPYDEVFNVVVTFKAALLPRWMR